MWNFKVLWIFNNLLNFLLKIFFFFFHQIFFHLLKFFLFFLILHLILLNFICIIFIALGVKLGYIILCVSLTHSAISLYNISILILLINSIFMKGFENKILNCRAETHSFIKYFTHINRISFLNKFDKIFKHYLILLIRCYLIEKKLYFPSF